MPAAVADIDAIVSKWTLRQRKQAIAAIFRGLKSKKPLKIKDEDGTEWCVVYPARPKVTRLNLDADTPEMRELKRRLEDRDSHITHEEMLKRVHALELKEGRE